MHFSVHSFWNKIVKSINIRLGRGYKIPLSPLVNRFRNESVFFMAFFKHIGTIDLFCVDWRLYWVMILKKTLPIDLATFFYFLKGSSSSMGIRVYSANSLKVIMWCFSSLSKYDLMSSMMTRAFLWVHPLINAISFVVIHILYGMFLIFSFEVLYRDLILYVFKNNN